MYQVDYTNMIGGLLIFIVLLWLICLACIVIQIIGLWKIFKKAGEPGWKCLIPVYNNYTLCKIIWGCGWYFLLFAVPIGGVVFMIVTYVKLAKVFGKSDGFAVGLVLLSPIFFMILGCDKSYYLGADTKGKGKNASIIVTAILGLIWLALFITSFMFTANSIDNSNAYIIKNNQDTGKASILKEDSIKNSNLDLSQYGDDAILATVTNGTTNINVPMWDGEYFYNEGSLASCSKNGVYINSSVGYSQLKDSSDLEYELSQTVKSYTEIYSNSDSYSNVYTDKVQKGENWASQQINYSYNMLGESYLCKDIVKVENVDDYPLIIVISFNSYNSTDNSQETLLNTYDMYEVKNVQ